ncbi:MAG TPA: hypothetical protein VFH29_00460, partial [Anaerolineales bacterium]|nr:hypothetical protein [Anaerolineales bacterium]
MTRIAPYGSWHSPITAKIAAQAAISFSDLHWDNDDLYWLEYRPSDGGRGVLICQRETGARAELTPPGFSVRSTVHEYGGGAFAVRDRTVFFVNSSDQRVYRQDFAEKPVPITPNNSYRYADLTIDIRRRRLIAIQEDHSAPGEAVNTIAGIPMNAGPLGTLISGNDFYSSPRISPNGDQLAYLTWNHPNMPWDGCELHLCELRADGSLGPGRRVAGGWDEAIFQPEWSPGGALHFVSDRTGWWNLYKWTGEAAVPLCPMEADFGRAMWLFGESTYGFAPDGRILCCYTEQGLDHLAWLNSDAGSLEAITCPYTRIDFLRCGPRQAAFVGGAPGLPTAIVTVDLQTGR